MKVSRLRLASVIADRLAANPAKEQQLSQEIAAFLLAEGRVDELDSLIRDIMQYRADRGTVEVVTTNAHPLTDKVKTDIKSVISQLFPATKQIIISEVIDQNIIGGVRLELANSQLDLSVRSKLNRFKQLTTAPGGI